MGWASRLSSEAKEADRMRRLRALVRTVPRERLMVMLHQLSRSDRLIVARMIESERG